MTIQDILNYLDSHEIDFRLESNFCCGYIFYFLDGSIYPRRYYDYELEGKKESIVAETVDHLITRVMSNELVKDWLYRFEADSLENLFKLVENNLIKRGAKF